MNNFRSRNTIIVYVLIFILLGVVGFHWFTKPKLGFVNITELYNEFEYKKELEKRYESTQLARKNLLDSLSSTAEYLKMQLISQEQKDSSMIKKYMHVYQQYKKNEAEYAEDNNRMAQELMNSILNQLNQYVRDYGAQEGYHFIYGANSDGSLMYAEDTYDLTEELTLYINQRYEGAE